MFRKTAAILFVLIIPSLSLAATLGDLHPKEHEGYEVKDGKMFCRHGNTGMIIEIANDDSIAKFYSDRGINFGNPFKNLGGEYQGNTIFILTLINRSQGNITFNPRYVTIRIKEASFFPMDFPVLLGFLQGLDRTKQNVLQKSIFHSSEVVSSGKIVSKFLIFPALPKKSDDLKLVFEYLYLESAEFKLEFYYTRKKSDSNGN